MTVRRLLSELDSMELTEWMAYYRLEEVDQQQQGNAAGLQSELKKGKPGMGAS